MDTYEAIFARHTVRDFLKRPVERPVLERIIGAGLKAPSNDHMRSWEFVIVDDPAKRLELIGQVKKEFTQEEIGAWLDSWHSTDPVQRQLYLDAVPKQHRMLLSAGTLIVPVFRQGPSPLLKPSSLSALNMFASVWCCIENMLIAASAEGIQGVMRIPFDPEIPHIRKTLGIPEHWEVPCYLALGYPDESAPRVRQFTPKASERIRENHW